jgi:hypothetical protein
VILLAVEVTVLGGNLAGVRNRTFVTHDSNSMAFLHEPEPQSNVRLGISVRVDSETDEMFRFALHKELPWNVDCLRQVALNARDTPASCNTAKVRVVHDEPR